MKKLASLTLSLFLLAGTAFADTPRDSEAQAAKPAKPAKKAATNAVKKPDAVALQLEELRQALQAQQAQLQALKEELAKRDRQIDEAREAAAAANARATDASTKATEASAKATEAINAEPAVAAAAVGAATAPISTRVDKVEKDLTASKKDFGEKIKGFGPFSFSGDMRVRDEPFIGGPTNHSQVRNRERLRLRFNVNAKFNDDFSGGFAVASGDINDPISTNQNTNQFYTRKVLGIDRAFITYNPHQFKPLVLTGGKFAYPYYHTEITWDNDLNPEGVAQTLQWDLKETPVLKRIALVGFELPFSEVAGQFANKGIVQSVVYGGQLQAVWELAPWLKLSTYGAFYNYHNADPIALAVARAGLSNPTTPLVGALPLGGNVSQNNLQNSMTTTASTSAITIEQNGVPTVVSTGVKTITNAQFASKFGLFDGIARFDIKTRYERLPLVVLGDYVQNTRACANVGNIIPLPANTATATFSQSTNAACVSRERRGYWLEGRAGRLSSPGDVQVAYTRMMIEREAVMTAFNYSDVRQGSNVSQHRLEVFYQWNKNVQLNFTGFFGRPLNWHVASGTAPEPLLKRLQFDVLYKF
jgi:hypothetical protein